MPNLKKENLKSTQVSKHKIKSTMVYKMHQSVTNHKTTNTVQYTTNLIKHSARKQILNVGAIYITAWALSKLSPAWMQAGAFTSAIRIRLESEV